MNKNFHLEDMDDDDFKLDDVTEFKMKQFDHSINEMVRKDPDLEEYLIKRDGFRWEENDDPYLRVYENNAPDETPECLEYRAAELKKLLLSYDEISSSDFKRWYGEISSDLYYDAEFFICRNPSASGKEAHCGEHDPENSLEEFIHILDKITAERVRDVPGQVTDDLMEFLDIEEAFDQYIEESGKVTLCNSIIRSYRFLD